MLKVPVTGKYGAVTVTGIYKKGPVTDKEGETYRYPDSDSETNL